jgi:hypothetical protein
MELKVGRSDFNFSRSTIPQNEKKRECGKHIFRTPFRFYTGITARLPLFHFLEISVNDIVIVLFSGFSSSGTASSTT